MPSSYNISFAIFVTYSNVHVTIFDQQVDTIYLNNNWYHQINCISFAILIMSIDKIALSRVKWKLGASHKEKFWLIQRSISEYILLNKVEISFVVFLALIRGIFHFFLITFILMLFALCCQRQLLLLFWFLYHLIFISYMLGHRALWKKNE